LDLIETKNFYAVNNTTKKGKKITHRMRETLTNSIYDKGLVSRTHKELLKDKQSN
jgi:hypothetical protein